MSYETKENLFWLKERVKYNPDTGVFRWLPRPRSDFKQVGRQQWWNREKAGNEITLRVSGYTIVFITLPNGARVRFNAHRLALAFAKGQWPTAEVDHINGIRTDNRLGNLREATRQQNACNLPLRANKTSRYRGVHYSASRQKWCAQISERGKNKNLGRFDTEDEAHIAYERAAREAYGPYARTGRR